MRIRYNLRTETISDTVRSKGRNGVFSFMREGALSEKKQTI